MQRRTRAATPADLAEQVGARHARADASAEESAAPAQPRLVSTGSTLLDLAISGEHYERGGLPGGKLVEVFGPSGCGKTVILCELAGGVQRAGGDVMFRDPEGRLNAQFAQLFDLHVDRVDYGMPDTVTDLFDPILKWKPKRGFVSGIFADSLAALSTNLELEKGDKMGQRRAKEFSEGCRKVCRVITRLDILMVCSNQLRQNVDAGPFEQKFKTPGGEAIPYYSDVRLRCHSPQRLTRERSIGGKDQRRVYGVVTSIEVVKNSVASPHKAAQIYIDFAYGIDDIRGNLEYVKSSLGLDSYNVLGDGVRLGATVERAIHHVEEEGLQDRLRDRTVEVWRDVEARFAVERRPKVRS